MSERKYASVIVPIPSDEGFTYRIPEELADFISPGIQVIVPFGNRYLSGIVVQVSGELPAGIAAAELKSIYDVVDTQPVVTPDLIRMLHWISDYYLCYLGEAFRLVHSSLNVGKSKLVIKRLANPEEKEWPASFRQVLEALPPERELSFQTLKKKLPLKSLRQVTLQMHRAGLIVRKYAVPTRQKPVPTELFLRVIPPEARDEKQREAYRKIRDGRKSKVRELLLLLEENPEISLSILREKGFSRREVNRLQELGLVSAEEKPAYRDLRLSYREEPREITLTDEQEEFLNKVRPYLEKRQYRTFLLHGVTGSGKTQVYIELIRETLAMGRQAIVLIPEIVLTPQTLSRFRNYFGDRVAVIHSRLSPAEKREVLYRIRHGHYQVVVGPRSALFAPLPELGLIIVDEEHESSYKQTDAQPRYHARDAAIFRASLTNAVVILGSATPSFESLYNARAGKYEYFRLDKRIEARAMPRITIVDLKEEWKKNQAPPVVSQNLELKIESRLLTHEQVMILLNRRGYAPYILCKECGYIAKCPNCDVTLTLHSYQGRLRCHYCGYQTKAPDVCPECESMDIVFKGIGTQRLEEGLKEVFPHARIIRMDTDTTRGKRGHLRILEKFRQGEADILVGTKMIAKGLDFERVTLVGVVMADQGLHFPDFRSHEKVFQLLTQAAGRAGRGAASGEVVVQTFDPNHYIFKYLLTHDYLSFYLKEVESRQHLNYPPFARLILIRVEGKEERLVQQWSDWLAKYFWKANRERQFQILGPAPAPISRIKNIFRYHILIKQPKEKSASMGYLRRLIKEGFFRDSRLKKIPVKITFDVDPVDIL